MKIILKLENNVRLYLLCFHDLSSSPPKTPHLITVTFDRGR